MPHPATYLAKPGPGPLERTAIELNRIARESAFRRRRVPRTRQLLRRSDALIDLVEQCRVLGLTLVPTAVWSALVRLVGEVDSEIRDELGIDRRLDPVATVLFSVQSLLLRRNYEERQPTLARIIPLFPPK